MRLRLDVRYDGAPFRGFWPNAGVETVGGVLINALSDMFKADIDITCSGRTDAGVHGRGQVVTFDVAEDAEGLVGRVAGLRAQDPKSRLSMVNRINASLPPTVRVMDVAVVPDTFDARFSALSRTYRYFVWNEPVADPLWRDRSWHIDSELRIETMRLASDAIIGLHDFTSFCRRPEPVPGAPHPPTMMRRVNRCSWHRATEDVPMFFEIEAKAFCHQMVRAIVGTMVDIGRGWRKAGQMKAILEARDRSVAGRVAPAHGLVFWSVTYPENL